MPAEQPIVPAEPEQKPEPKPEPKPEQTTSMPTVKKGLKRAREPGDAGHALPREFFVEQGSKGGRPRENPFEAKLPAPAYPCKQLPYPPH